MLSKAFLSKYFPPGKTAKLRIEITSSFKGMASPYMRLGRGSRTSSGNALIMAFLTGF